MHILNKQAIQQEKGNAFYSKPSIMTMIGQSTY